MTNNTDANTPEALRRSIIKRTEEICNEFDKRAAVVGISFARLELAKSFAQFESQAFDDRTALNAETNRADAAGLRAAVLEQRDETETMNIGAALFAEDLLTDDGIGEYPAGPCANALSQWRSTRFALQSWERIAGDRAREIIRLSAALERTRELADRIPHDSWCATVLDGGNVTCDCIKAALAAALAPAAPKGGER